MTTSDGRRLADASGRLNRHREKHAELKRQLDSLHGVVTAETESLQRIDDLLRAGEAAYARLVEAGFAQLAEQRPAAPEAASIAESIAILESAVSESQWAAMGALDSALQTYRKLEDEERAEDSARLQALTALVERYREVLDQARAALAATREDERLCAEVEAVLAQVRRDFADDEYQSFAAGLERLAHADLERRIASVGNAIREAGDHWQLAELMLIRSAGQPVSYEVILRMPGEAGGHGLSVRATAAVAASSVRRLCDRARSLDDLVAAPDTDRRREARDAERIARPSADSLTTARTIGEDLYDLLIPRSIRSYLARVPCSLTISTNDLDLPLELLCAGSSTFLSLERPISRMPLGTTPERSYSKQRYASPRGKIRFLLIGANGSNDLPHVPREIEMIQKALRDAFGDAVVVDTPAATLGVFSDAIRSASYHVIHYAGHAEYDPDQPDRSGLRLDDGSIPAAEIERMMRGNPIVFLNGCKTTATATAQSQILVPAEGLSASFIYGGALGCIGNAWPVHDGVAADFAASFYRHLVAGHTLGKAMLHARSEVHRRRQIGLTWAGFVLFGNPLFRLNWNHDRPQP